MPRVTEPLLMLSSEQVASYAAVNRVGLTQLIMGAVNSLSLLPKTVVDIGCGCGELTKALAQHFSNATVTGYDGSEEMLKVALQKTQETPNLNFVNAIVTSPTDIKADLTVSSMAAHHAAELTSFLNTLKEMTTPNGAVFIVDMLREEKEENRNVIVNSIINDFFNFSSGVSSECFRQDFTASLQACYSLEEVTDSAQKVFKSPVLSVTVLNESKLRMFTLFATV